MSEPYKDWIVRFYANHNDIPEGHADGGIVGELIRCKDCKHSLHNQFTGDWYCWLYNIAREVESDGFCYKAKRRNDD